MPLVNYHSFLMSKAVHLGLSVNYFKGRALDTLKDQQLLGLAYVQPEWSVTILDSNFRNFSQKHSLFYALFLRLE